jgi:hypothetical protein
MTKEKKLEDINYCGVCQRVVLEGSEHDPEPHGSTKERATELLAWKQSFQQ